MSQFAFSFGERIKVNNELYQLRRKIGEEKWQLEQELTGEYVIMDESELLKLYYEKLLTFVGSYIDIEKSGIDDGVIESKISRNFSDYPEKHQAEAKRRLQYVKAIAATTANEFSQEIKEKAVEISDSEPPSTGTVKRWAKMFKTSRKNMCSLIPNYAGRGNKTPRYSDEVIEIAIKKLSEIYLTANKGSITATLSAIRHAIELENMSRPVHKKLPKPERTFVRNIIAAMDAYEIMSARFGKNVADKHFREANTSGKTVKEPLERAEIDHTILDLIIVSETTYLPLGRPTLTLMLDRCTGVVLGYHISYDPPSYKSIMKCLQHAIKPKEYIKDKYPEIENSWPCWGIPELLVVDNGREFHSKDLETAAMSLLIHIRYCPGGQPWWKGAVERFFRTLEQSGIHPAPGTTFSNIQEKGEYNPTKMAVLTEADLHELLHTWICDVYHQTPQRSTLRAPMSLWRERITSIRQHLPESVEVLDVSLASVEHRTLFHYGVSLNNLNYNSPELQKIKRKRGELKVQIRWDRSDLGFVHVLEKTANVYLRVPCTWLSYASGLSLWLHKAIRDEAMSHEGPESQVKLDAAKARVRSIYEKALANKKQVTRKSAARAQQSFENINSEKLQNQMEPIQEQLLKQTGKYTKIDEFMEPFDDIPDFEVVEMPKKLKNPL